MARMSVLLPQPGRAGDEQDLARVDGQRQVDERRLRRASVAEGEPLDLDDPLRHGPFRQARRIRIRWSRRAPSRRAASPWLSA